MGKWLCLIPVIGGVAASSAHGADLGLRSAGGDSIAFGWDRGLRSKLLSVDCSQVMFFFVRLKMVARRLCQC